MKNLFAFNTSDEAFAVLNKAILLDDWRQAFCKNDDGELNNFYRPESQVRKYAAVFKTGGFNAESEVPDLLRSALKSHIYEISEWLCTPRMPSLTLTVKFDHPVGYTLEADGEKLSSDTVRLVLRKDHNSGTHYGFFVSTFMPI